MIEIADPEFSEPKSAMERLEEMGADDLAYRVMDLLVGCSPKDFSPCDNRLSTKGSLERLIEQVKRKID